MEVIDISSSESENDDESERAKSQDISCNDGGTGNWNNNSDCSIHIPQLNGHLEEKSRTKSPQQSRKRTLPHSFQQTSFQHVLRPDQQFSSELAIPRQKKRAQVASHIRPGVEVDNAAHERQELDAEVFLGNHKRNLQSSHLTPSEGFTDYQGGGHIHNLPQTNHDSGKANSMFYMRDDYGRKDEFPYENNGKHRILPNSLNNGKSVANNQVNSFQKSRGNGEYPDFREKASPSLGTNPAFRFPPSIKSENFVTSTAPKFSSDGRDDILMYDKSKVNRVLPPSFVHGKFNGSQPTGSNHAASHPGLPEQMHVEVDERVIYQEALQNLSQPKVEDDLPEGLLAVPLLKHQRIALAWMVQKENSMHCTGGILADDQGLGKTVSTIALIQKQMPLQSEFTSDDSRDIKSVTLNLDEDDDGVAEVEKTLKAEKSDVEIEECKSNDLKIEEGKPIRSQKNDTRIEKDDHRRKPMGTSIQPSYNSKPPAGTLIVCPASILRQWDQELREKVTDNAKLSVLIYHGSSRTKVPPELARYNVVLTTYAIVTNEVPKQNLADDDGEKKRNMDKYGISSDFFPQKKQKKTSNTRGKRNKKGKESKQGHIDYDSGPLAKVRWFRVVLDEAQTIKNYRTQVARACCGLRAKRRWCLSGTPIQNSIDDLYSYFRFLKYDPYATYSVFCSKIKLPVSRNAHHGYKKLQAVLKTVLLRRTKDTLIDGEPIVKIPPKSVSLKKVDFSPDERDFYVRLETDSRNEFKKYDDAGTVKQNFASILVMLLRLRQACNHPSLVQKKQSDTIEKHSLEMTKQLPPEMLSNLLNQLDSLSICSVCSDPPEDAVVTICGHVFCYQCVSDCVTGDDNQCPQAGCKEILGTDVLFTQATLKSCISNYDDNHATSSSSTYDEEPSITQHRYVSSKIKATVEILKSICNQTSDIDSKAYDEADICPNKTFNPITEGSSSHNAQTPPVKAIVFSQWTGMLDLIEDSLNHSLLQFRRLDGKMSLAARDMAVKEFNSDPEVTVMLMSLKAGNLGLNMTAASHVILLDPWWNPSAEDQAVDRAHRIGQTRPVTISRLTIKGTVEDRILSLQEKKKAMVSSAFGEDQNGVRAPRLTVEDLRYLFM